MPRKQSLWERAIGDEYQFAVQGKKKKSVSRRDSTVPQNRMEQLLDHMTLAFPGRFHDSTPQCARESAPPNLRFPAASRIAFWNAAGQLQQQRPADAPKQPPHVVPYSGHVALPASDVGRRRSTATVGVPPADESSAAMPGPPLFMRARQPIMGADTASMQSLLATATLLSSQGPASARADWAPGMLGSRHHHQRKAHPPSRLQPAQICALQASMQHQPAAWRQAQQQTLPDSAPPHRTSVLCRPAIGDVPQSDHTVDNIALCRPRTCQTHPLTQAQLTAQQTVGTVTARIPVQMRPHWTSKSRPTRSSVERHTATSQLAVSHVEGSVSQNCIFTAAGAVEAPHHSPFAARILRTKRPKYLSADSASVLVPVNKPGTLLLNQPLQVANAHLNDLTFAREGDQPQTVAVKMNGEEDIASKAAVPFTEDTSSQLQKTDMLRSAVPEARDGTDVSQADKHTGDGSDDVTPTLHSERVSEDHANVCVAQSASVLHASPTIVLATAGLNATASDGPGQSTAPEHSCPVPHTPHAPPDVTCLSTIGRFSAMAEHVVYNDVLEACETSLTRRSIDLVQEIGAHEPANRTLVYQALLFDIV